MLCKEQGITVLGLNAVFDILVIGKLDILAAVRKVLHKDKSQENAGMFKNGGLLFRIALLTIGGTSMLYIRWKIMGTGPPAFTEVDNPASFADSMLVRNPYSGFGISCDPLSSCKQLVFPSGLCGRRTCPLPSQRWVLRAADLWIWSSEQTH